MARLLRFLKCLLWIILMCSSCSSEIRSINDVNHQTEEVWAVQLNQLSADKADELASRFGMTNQGRLPLGENIFIFKRSKQPPTAKRELQASLSSDPSVLWSQEQVPLKRAKRVFEEPTDPLYRSQWHLHNTPGRDTNVVEAWKLGYTGKGVTICIVDEGLQGAHPDLKDNYRSDGSYDFNNNKANPDPLYFNSHGTEAAGTAAAGRNAHCGVGTAYDAHLTGLKLLELGSFDYQEAQALSFKVETINDILSNSWGPDDDGKGMIAPGPLTSLALEKGITSGRGGLGSIYMWAAGNGKPKGDNCNYDGFANSRYTIAVGSIDRFGKPTSYSEPCSALTVVTPSSDGNIYIITTGLKIDSISHDGCSLRFTGTSASSPMAAGIAALILEANKSLTWRDVKGVIIGSATHIDPGHVDWQLNAAGYKVNHFYGFGKIDAGRAVKMAANWTLLPPEKSINSLVMSVPVNLPVFSNVNSNITVMPNGSFKIEHIDVKVVANVVHRGKLSFTLISPSGVKSRLAELRDDMAPNIDWTFTTQFNYGESADGVWSLLSSNQSPEVAVLKSWKMTFWGH
eukprot:TRINITY_DN2491_c0_g1_i1.p1 TRINITY_DN2491_c0_g1~~TRINITY_DN2491_c0_g1_i1.p1  ORF type:complete len:570 (-),score=160.79 TRINITY_DN2491_c0_g1_i1:42-1751(-)